MRATKKYFEPTAMEEEVVKQSRGPSTRSRKPLGDITNATAGIPRPVIIKKPSTGTQQPTAPSDIILETREIMMLDDDRPYMLREADDIDARDSGNALLCSEYVNDMYTSFWRCERDFMVNASYLTQQNFINEKMRSILVDWLVEVHLKFKMVPETLYLTVNLIDRYLEKKQVRRSKLQLVGVSALLLAAKYEEIYPPELHDLVFITDRAYTVKEILEMESEIANTLDYNLTVPTVHTFLCRYLKAAHADRTMVQMACYLAERSLQEYSTLKFLPSLVAAKAIHSSRMSLRRHPWSPTLVNYTKYDEPDMEQCGAEMREYMANPSNSQTAVSRKYSSSKFGGVAKMPVTI